ncbi:MAG: F0F1 ATP synthase subunit alpha [Firmicutes bacterium]|nr:F0F1 ATP synthase subunit alpha [Bacillota bacterium]
MQRVENEIKTAVLYSDTKPSDAQTERFVKFLKEKYQTGIELCWEKSEGIKNGFRLTVGNDVYDWTLDGRFRQLKKYIKSMAEEETDLIPLLKEGIEKWTPAVLSSETGTVLTVGDCVATVGGLKNAFYGEILIFADGVKGMVQTVDEDICGCILFDESEELLAGTPVRHTGKIAGIPCGTGFLGRVTNALGLPIDAKGAIESEQYRPVENAAPGIISREAVNKPLHTGIMAIDAIFPIGKGQRELIIGDRQTGKSSIAIDTIINQKGRDVICIYVSIGQKTSFVSNLVATLSKYGAMEYTAVISASAGEAATLQYLAPYAGCALGEYFMERGKDVLIVYDDLSKHAVAYREISLLLGRSPGREAYPGDVFYLHSRLLERSAHLSNELGGGSMTALPIVETLAGDVSAYIPTNIISITDGQIFLESSLFYSGQRPAINIGLSVSRVGGNAQTKAMKKAAKTLRLDLAQYREMEIFMQFSSELDEETRRRLLYGQGLMRMLRQKQASPLELHKQVIMLIAAMGRCMQKTSPDQVHEYLESLVSRIEAECPEICRGIDDKGDYSPEDEQKILEIARSVGD